MFIWACNMSGTQSVLCRVREIVAVRRDHHAVTGRKAECFTGGEIDPRLGLEVTRDLRTEDRIPWNRIASREIDHQRDIAVGDRRQPEFPFERCHAGWHVGPGVEPMPGEIEVA